MATYRHWSVSLWRDPDDVPHCWILSHDETEWWLHSADEYAVLWLSSYGSWHAYEKKNIVLWHKVLLIDLEFCTVRWMAISMSTRSSAVAKRPHDASCLYSFNTKRRAQSLLLVVSASDIPLHTIKFFSVLFSSAYSSMLQAITNKHSLVRRWLRSTLHGRR